MGKVERSGYVTDVADEEWLFVLPYLLLSREDNGSRQHDLRAIFNAVRYVVKGGNQWRLTAHYLTPLAAAGHQGARLVRGRYFALIADDRVGPVRAVRRRDGHTTLVPRARR